MPLLRLASMGIEYTRVPGNGIIATIKGTAPDAYDAEGNPRRRIALRSDIDALPVTELTGRSVCVGKRRRHACVWPRLPYVHAARRGAHSFGHDR